MPSENIINLRPYQDRYTIFKDCNRPCEDECGACQSCADACGPDCREGILDGNGHVWRLNDRLPGFLVPDLYECFKNGLDNVQLTEGVEFMRETSIKLIKRSYPKVDEDRLRIVLDVDAMAAIIATFLSRMAPPGTTDPVVPPTTPTPLTRATRKSRSS